MRSLRRLLVIAASAVVLGFSATATASAEPVALPPQDSTYLVVSHQGHMAEMISGARAALGGMCPQVRQLGAMLVADHTRLDAMGAAVALPNGVMLPLTPNPDQIQQIMNTSVLMGRDFDLAWLRMQERFHIQSLQAGAQEQTFGTSDQVKTLARNAEPVVAHHLMMVRDALTRC
ncbi:DUF4142 domain-containing protein [Nocardia sp. CDC159]|uniref:DUF4142 domain-containing protein n=1 Tax=Nocardia pulmonis TaxID=2951408 RepID=A0A9X2EDL4_9NOCA|nr:MULTISPECIES: DUF4142 domain-containing protein [Nocardia]MCM6778386.1 DUF4142 domain-containing protein [Nocardia pulmonis]MCM6791218.1 DUF4142 domain-containing protein [Nocardia sp. CDC159]